jgi:hypothetical protein
MLPRGGDHRCLALDFALLERHAATRDDESTRLIGRASAEWLKAYLGMVDLTMVGQTIGIRTASAGQLPSLSPSCVWSSSR